MCEIAVAVVIADGMCSGGHCCVFLVASHSFASHLASTSGGNFRLSTFIQVTVLFFIILIAFQVMASQSPCVASHFVEVLCVAYVTGSRFAFSLCFRSWRRTLLCCIPFCGSSVRCIFLVASHSFASHLASTSGGNFRLSTFIQVTVLVSRRDVIFSGGHHRRRGRTVTRSWFAFSLCFMSLFVFLACPRQTGV